MRKRILLCAAITGCFIVSSRCERALALGLEDAVTEALRRNPELLAARQQLEVADAELVKARYLNPFNPEVSASGAHREFDEGGSEAQAGAGLSLEVEIAGQRGKRVAAAKTGVDIARARIANEERMLRWRVVDAFYSVLHARERLALSREIEELNRRFSDASSARFQAGESAKMEPNLAAIRYSQARREQLAAERDYAAAITTVERLLGRSTFGSLRLEGKLQIEAHEIPDTETLVARALRHRPDLAATGLEVMRVNSEQALNRRLLVPNVTVGAFYEQEAEAGGGRDRIVGGGVKIPLPVFDRRQSETKALAARRTQAEYERQGLAASIRAEVESAARAYRAAARVIEVYDAGGLERISENLRFVETAYKAGKVDLLESIVVQNDLVEAKAGYLDSLRDYWQAHSLLECALGTPLIGETVMPKEAPGDSNER